MTNSRSAAVWSTVRHVGGLTGILVALLTLAACGEGGKMGKVTGTVTVDGKIPAEGSSITFFPTDGKSPSAGGLIEKGKYSASVAVGKAKVEIRAPRPMKGGKAKAEEGPSVGNLIEESLPAKYNDKSELTFEVKSGTNEKNWELSTKEN